MQRSCVPTPGVNMGSDLYHCVSSPLHGGPVPPGQAIREFMSIIEHLEREVIDLTSRTCPQCGAAFAVHPETPELTVQNPRAEPGTKE